MSSITGKVNSKAKVAGEVSPSSGVKNYEDLEGKPSINGVEVSGDKTAADYGVKPNDIIVNISGDKETGYTSDKTFAEIKELLDSGHTVNVKTPNKAILSDIYLNTSYLIMWQRYEGLTYFNVNITRNDVVSFSQNVTKASDIQFGGVMADAKTDDDTIPARIGEDGKLYVSAKPKDFIVNGVVKDGQLTADKTNAEIYKAYQEGRTIKFVYLIWTAELEGQVLETQAVFESYSPTTMTHRRVTIIKDELTLVTDTVVPTKNNLGGVKANTATENDTVPVNVNEDGFLKASVNIPEKTDEDASTYDKITPIKIDPKTRRLYGKNDYLPGKSVYYWNNNSGHTNDLGAIMEGSYTIGIVSGRTNVDGMTLPIFIIKGSTERGSVNFTGLDSSGNIWKGSYNLMNMEVSSLAKVTLGGS